MLSFEIPGYRIERALGRGGMASVYLAEQRSLCRPVAIKVLATDLAADTDFVERFKREARLVAQLNHPHIVSIYDIGVAADHPYLALEYIGGGDLRARLGKGAIPPEQALGILSQIGRALQRSHAQGIIHRDIKPENILFRPEGDAVVGDFGIAKSVSANTHLTQTGLIIGSPHYMSPEQMRGQVLDGRADIYSLGIVFHELLTGQAPYTANDTLAIAFKHLNDPIPRLPDQLGCYQSLLDRLLAKEPDQRLPDADSLLAAINELTEPSQAKRVTAEQHAQAGDSTVIRPRHAQAQAQAKSTDPSDGAAARPLAFPAPNVRLPSSLVSHSSDLVPKDTPAVPESEPDRHGIKFIMGVSEEVIELEIEQGTIVPIDSEPSSPLSTGQHANARVIIGLLLGVALAVSAMAGAWFFLQPEMVSRLPELVVIETDSQKNAEIQLLEEARRQAESLRLEQEDEQQRRLEVRLAACHEHMEHQRYIHSPNDNAVDCYHMILALDPDNASVAAAFADMRAFYLRTGQAALDAGNYDRVRDLIQRINRIAHDTPEARHLQTALAEAQPPTPALTAPTTSRRQEFEPEMIAIRAGCFQVGSPTSETGRFDDERQHQVCVENFQIGKYEVTQAQWEAVMGTNPSRFSGCANCPVEQVSWNGVQDYIDKLNTRTGKRYRLPTEAEWEYAARAGTTNTYPWGDSIGRNRANCRDCGSQWDNKRTAPVGSFQPNAWGLYDTAGNVWEWTCSAYEKNYGDAEQRCFDKNHAGTRALRGGSWNDGPSRVRSAFRAGYTADGRGDYLGFRLAQD